MRRSRRRWVPWTALGLSAAVGVGLAWGSVWVLRTSEWRWRGSWVMVPLGWVRVPGVEDDVAGPRPGRGEAAEPSWAWEMQRAPVQRWFGGERVIFLFTFGDERGPSRAEDIERVLALFRGEAALPEAPGVLEWAVTAPWWDKERESLRAVYRYGWPLRSYARTFTGAMPLARAAPSQNFREGGFWLWPGLIGNAVIFGAVLFPAMLTPWVVVWRRRYGRKRCVACGYDLRGSAGGVCPECGESRAERASVVC